MMRLAASTADIVSDSMDDKDVTGCFEELQEMRAVSKKMRFPDVLLASSQGVLQSPPYDASE